MTWEGNGVSAEFRRNRRFVLMRDAYVCQICKKPGATVVDHKRARKLGGTDALDNLQAAHASCNARKAASLESKRRYATHRVPEPHPGTIS